MTLVLQLNFVRNNEHIRFVKYERNHDHIDHRIRNCRDPVHL